MVAGPLDVGVGDGTLELEVVFTGSLDVGVDDTTVKVGATPLDEGCVREVREGDAPL